MKSQPCGGPSGHQVPLYWRCLSRPNWSQFWPHFWEPRGQFSPSTGPKIVGKVGPTSGYQNRPPNFGTPNRKKVLLECPRVPNLGTKMDPPFFRHFSRKKWNPGRPRVQFWCRFRSPRTGDFWPRFLVSRGGHPTLQFDRQIHSHRQVLRVDPCPQ